MFIEIRLVGFGYMAVFPTSIYDEMVAESSKIVCLYAGTVYGSSLTAKRCMFTVAITYMRGCYKRQGNFKEIDVRVGCWAVTFYIDFDCRLCVTTGLPLVCYSIRVRLNIKTSVVDFNKAIGDFQDNDCIRGWRSYLYIAIPFQVEW